MKVEEYISPLIRAGLDNDTRSIRAISTKIIRNIKNENPLIAQQISEALNFYGAGLSSTRSIGYDALPQDLDSRADLLIVQEPIEVEKPIFNDKVNDTISMIIDERNNITKLTSLGLSATSSILLYGEPGVGKTLLAKYLSSVFNLKFASLDMSSAISSYLGKTGQNLKKVLDYAKQQPTLLLLDEFDAIAKKRDDSTDLGELKRVVNILLKELEDWAPHSILIAATNHPKLLDKAIWRRFETTIEIPIPDKETRIKILESAFIDTNFYREIKKISALLSELLEGMSPADIIKICEKAKKQSLMYEKDVRKSIVLEIANMTESKNTEFNKKFCKIAQSKFNMTYREMATILDKSVSAVQNYMKRGVNIE